MSTASLVATARRLLTKHGREVVLRQLDKDPASATEPWKGPPNPRANFEWTQTLPGVFVPLASAVELGMKKLPEDLARRCLNVLICTPPDGVTTDLTTAHELVDGGLVYGVLYADTLRPGNTTFLHFFAVGR